MLRVLIVDDQRHVLDAMELLFEMRGDLQVLRASTPAEAESLVRAGGVGVVVQDMNFSEGTTGGDEGAALFGRLRRIDPDLPVILMTAWGSVERAVELVKAGADDYLTKPFSFSELLARVQALREHVSVSLLSPDLTAYAVMDSLDQFPLPEESGVPDHKVV